MSACEAFLRALWGEDDVFPWGGQLVVWTLQDRRSYWCKGQGQAVRLIESLSDTKDVYITTCLHSQDGAYRLYREQHPESRGDPPTRGCVGSVVAAPGFWLDVDVGKPQCPTGVEEAVGWLRGLETPPSMLVGSGGGLHAWWLLRESVDLRDADERGGFAHKLLTYYTFLSTRAREQGWRFDNTSDLARVLRPPGAWNHKQKPARPTKIIV